ncbi:MAG: DUF169 domain-containing protein, partial [Actinomycetota bacterium]|nr:DUF169 domain-containing protein [Actinomycetota bacterium]
RICEALKRSSGGESFVIDESSSVCRGGSWHCGLSGPPRGDALRSLQEFLTKGEKLVSSIASFERMQKLVTPPPTGIADRMLISPASVADFRPDLFVFMCNPSQACRIITLDGFWDGIPPRVEMGGSLCHSVIAYPIVSGNTNVSFGDWTARRAQDFEENVVFVTVPFERTGNLVLAIPNCTAGTAEMERKGFQNF